MGMEVKVMDLLFTVLFLFVMVVIFIIPFMLLFVLGCAIKVVYDNRKANSELNQ
jgi:hypothetical protein